MQNDSRSAYLITWKNEPVEHGGSFGKGNWIEFPSSLTGVEQQGKLSEELNQLWDEDFWNEIFSQDVVDEWDRLIDDFNQAT